MLKLPTLYHKGKTGKLFSWDVQADGDTVTVTAGSVDGKKIVSPKKVEQKNIGRSNETSLEAQAIKEAKALWQFKVTRKYSETPQDAQQDLNLPMLADDFEKRKSKITYPVHAQPKLDGVRCTAKWEDGRVVLTSRSGREWTEVPHINKELEKVLPEDMELDGELYVHGKTFQEITRLVKKQRPETVSLEYHVYDIPSDKEWEHRNEDLKKFYKLLPSNSKITVVDTYVITNEKAVYELHDTLVSKGYEGLIVRLLQGLYLFGYRSKELLKVKRFDDAEFKVVGYDRGVGKYANSVIWICVNEQGVEFRANPKITISEKEEFLKNADKYVGQLLKVRFFGRSEEGQVRFPVALGFRLSEDM